MKQTMTLIAFVAIILLLSSQKGIVLQAGPSYLLPAKKDTIPALLLCTDSTRFKGDYINPTSYEREGFVVLGGNQWTPLYLSLRREKLPSVVVVWNFILLRDPKQ